VRPVSLLRLLRRSAAFFSTHQLLSSFQVLTVLQSLDPLICARLFSFFSPPRRYPLPLFLSPLYAPEVVTGSDEGAAPPPVAPGLPARGSPYGVTLESSRSRTPISISSLLSAFLLPHLPGQARFTLKPPLLLIPLFPRHTSESRFRSPPQVWYYLKRHIDTGLPSPRRCNEVPLSNDSFRI